MAAAPAGLKFPAKLLKLQLQNGDLEYALKSKLKTLFGQGSLTDNVTRALEDLTPKLTLRTNKRDGNLDQRRIRANSHFHEIGAIPNVITSPQKAALEDHGYVADQKKAINTAQYQLFIRLLTNGQNLTVSADGQLKRDGVNVTWEELCDIVDEFTRTFMFQQPCAESITTGMEKRKEITQLYDPCLEVVTGRIALSETFGDDILHEGDWRKWAKHVQMIASFGALAVVLKSLLI